MSAPTIDTAKLSRGRAECLKCGKKGMGYAGHPHAFGYKDYNFAACRYCRARAKLKGDSMDDTVQATLIDQAKQ